MFKLIDLHQYNLEILEVLMILATLWLLEVLGILLGIL